MNRITPIEVKLDDKGINYDDIIKEFGVKPITSELISRFEKTIGRKAHPLLRRGIYFSHRDLEHILLLHEKQIRFYIYTGRGPSSASMHIGHMIPFIFTRWLQEVFDCPVVIQLTDDEKFFWKGLDLQTTMQLARENCKDIISFGFDKDKTFIFQDTEYIKEMYPNVCKIQKKITYNQVKAIFGFTDSTNCGTVAFPAIQAAPSFSSTFLKLMGDKQYRCLIPCAIDQDPYFRMTRDVAPRIGELKPSLIYCKFIPGLKGLNSKMSSSIPNSAIFLTDTPKQIRKKIGSSVSGGGKTMKDQRKYGAKICEDVAYHYLTFFLDDDEELERIHNEYKTGHMLTGEVKKILIDVLIPIIQNIQEKRLEITDDIRDEFMSIRKLF